MILIQLSSSDVNLINIHAVNTALNAIENANENDSCYDLGTGEGEMTALCCAVAT